MRLKALGNGGNLGIALIILATWLLASCALIIGLQIKDAPAAERKCAVSRETIESVMAANGHEKISELKDEWKKDFIREWNASDPKAPGATTAAVYTVSKNAPFIRLAFFNGPCFIDYFDLPQAALMQFIQGVIKKKGNTI